MAENKVHTAIVLDWETGGFSPQESACVQLAARSIRLDTFETIDSINLLVYPYHKINPEAPKRKLKRKNEEEVTTVTYLEYSDGAKKIHGFDFNDLINEGIEIQKVCEKFIEFAKAANVSGGKGTKPFIVGQNIMFDIGFLQQMFVYAGKKDDMKKVLSGMDDFYGNFQPIYMDTLQMLKVAFCHNPSVTTFNLESCADRLGVSLDNAHDADADVLATTNIFMILGTRMRSSDGSGVNSIIQESEKDRENHFRI